MDAMIYKTSLLIIFITLEDAERGVNGLIQPPSLVLIPSVVLSLKTQVTKVTGVIPRMQLFSTTTTIMPFSDMDGV